MIDDNKTHQEKAKMSRGFNFIGAEAALKRAGIKARRRAIETSGSVAIYRDGKIVHVKEIPGLYDDESEED